jgi:predicted acyltransferase
MNRPECEPPELLETPSQRLASLDQFRGYTVLGMLLVNFVGVYAVCPKIFQHSNTYISYADTIMPQFFFAVGFAFRLTFGRRVELQGTAAAYRRVVRRLLGLALISLVIYRVGPRAESWQALTELGLWGAIAGPLKCLWFQTLMHIAVTGLWLVPVIRSSPRVRVLWIVGSAAAHVVLSYGFYFDWVNGISDGVPAIDGGPLGFLSWTIPTGVGTLACDAVVSHRSRKHLIGTLLGWAVLLMGLGYLMSCGTRFYDVPAEKVESLRGNDFAEHPVWPTTGQIEANRNKSDLAQWMAEPPFVLPPSSDLRKWNYWMMSQQAGTISYLTFSAGFSLVIYVLFYVACDWRGLQLPIFRTFGTNALAAYVIHGLVDAAIKPFVPMDAPGWYIVAGLLIFFWITWVFVRSLEKQKIYLRV